MDTRASATTPDAKEIRGRLARSGLRITRQRIALGALIFGGGPRHFSAADLHLQAIEARLPVSIATIYNTLNRLSGAGVLREVAGSFPTTIYDTNIADHHHFYVEATGAVTDVPLDALAVNRLPEAPEGYEIVRVEAVVRLRRHRT